MKIIGYQQFHNKIDFFIFLFINYKFIKYKYK